MTSTGNKRLVVVVEDDDAVRWLLCELLEMAGFQTIGCTDGSEGLKTARLLRPSLLTLDLHMPGMDGLEALDRLAGEEGTATLPVVLVTGYSPDSQVRSHPQVKAIVRKPFDARELCQTVRIAAKAA